MDVVLQFGLQGVVAFGAVGVISHFKKDLTTEMKLGLLFVTAFLVGFVPADLGDVLFNRVKEAVGIALGIHATWTVAKKVGGNE